VIADALAKALGGHRGGAWMARCPAHDDRKPRGERVNAAKAEWSDKALASEKVEARQP
jgi:hypothetical protein